MSDEVVHSHVEMWHYGLLEWTSQLGPSGSIVRYCSSSLAPLLVFFPGPCFYHIPSPNPESKPGQAEVAYLSGALAQAGDSSGLVQSRSLICLLVTGVPVTKTQRARLARGALWIVSAPGGQCNPAQASRHGWSRHSRQHELHEAA